MILGHISHLQHEKSAFAPNIQRGLQYLYDTDLLNMEPGTYEIDGKDLYVIIEEYQTQPKSRRRPEAHGQYIDIQYIVQGREMIGHSVKSSRSVVYQDQLADKDVVFYQAVDNEIELILSPGMYAVFLPFDIHRPCCKIHTRSYIKKAVVKVKINS